MKRYVWIFVGVCFVLLIGSSIYKQIQKDNKSAKSTRISCHKNTTAFEKVYTQNSLKNLKQKLEEGNFELSSSVQKAVYSKSKLFDYINLEDMDKIVFETLNSYLKQENLNNEKLKISYYIYENDVEDPGKKTQKSKLYAGYVVFRFSDNKNELVYQVQIDFMDKKGADLPQSIKCAIKSFITL